MFTPWLKPAPRPDGGLAAHTIGNKLSRQRSKRKTAVAIIGLDAGIAEKTRAALNALSWDFGKLNFSDFGDVRKDHPEFLIPLLRELHAGGIIPVLLGGDPAGFRAQYLAFSELARLPSLLQIDQRVDVSPTERGTAILDDAVYRDSGPDFHLSHIGSQQHLVDPAIRDLFYRRTFESVRLGAARADLTELEPVIRDADLVGCHIRAVQFTEAPARPGFDPSGFSLQEASQLAFYAGNSDKLTSFGLYGMETAGQSDTNIRLTAAAYAQLVWYFLHGLSQRSGDFPATTKGMLEYVVDIHNYDRLTFWRSPRSNRWWVQCPAGTFGGEERHRLLPCSYQDYLTASSEQELPERLLRAFRRF